MTDNIFATYAPLHFAVSLPVIPLVPRNKMPAISGWSTFGKQMPTGDDQRRWINDFSDSNIGLPFGLASGLCGIDIDTDDEELIRLICDALPPTPWVRRGKKGMGLVFRWEGQKNFKLRGADGGMICEFLGEGNQMVLPPSVHPDCRACGEKNVAGPQGLCSSCGAPSLVYSANSDLWKVLEEVQPLPMDVEARLRAALNIGGRRVSTERRSGAVEMVRAGERDIQMVKQAGYLARVVLGIDKQTQFSLADAVDQLTAWVSNLTEEVAGDCLDGNKAIDKLLEFIHKDVVSGRVLPKGWDKDLPEWLVNDPRVQAIVEANEPNSWSIGRMVAALTDACPDEQGRERVEETIAEIISLAARDPSIGEYQVQCFHERITQSYPSLRLKWSTLKALYKEAKALAQHTEDFRDHYAAACAVLADLRKSGEIRFDNGHFWQWVGSHWIKVLHDDIHLHIARTVRGAAIVKKESDYAAIVKLLSKECRQGLSEHPVRGVNFANGFVNSNGDLIEHDREHGCTFTLPFDYRPELASQCQGWLAFLQSCWGDEPDYEERVLALQEGFAATLVGMATEFQQAFLLFGLSGSGKSQVLRVLEALLPDGACVSLSPDTWDHRFFLTRFVGAAANICNELPEQGKIKGNTFKQVVDGSQMFTEHKGKDGFEFVPTCAHWFASNFLPTSGDTSGGFARRWLILEFNKRVSEQDQERDIGARLAEEEREAIAAWALAGLPRLLQQGAYTQPACHKRRLAQVRIANNSVLNFMENCRHLERGSGSIQLYELHEIYFNYVKLQGLGKPARLTDFELMLEDLGAEISRRYDLTGSPVTEVIGIERRRYAA